jgi:hypothetical protein
LQSICFHLTGLHCVILNMEAACVSEILVFTFKTNGVMTQENYRCMDLNCKWLQCFTTSKLKVKKLITRIKWKWTVNICIPPREIRIMNGHVWGCKRQWTQAFPLLHDCQDHTHWHYQLFLFFLCQIHHFILIPCLLISHRPIQIQRKTETCEIVLEFFW